MKSRNCWTSEICRPLSIESSRDPSCVIFGAAKFALMRAWMRISLDVLRHCVSRRNTMREAGRMDLGAITANLVLDRQGIWVSGGRSNISYPEGGNELCFNVEN